MGSICYVAFELQSHAEAAHTYLTQDRHWCLPIDQTNDGVPFFGFLIGGAELPSALRQVLGEFYTIDIEVHPLNERQSYQNYVHHLYYNDEEDLEDAIGYLIDIDKQALAFREDENSGERLFTYTWSVVFCTEEKLTEAQKETITAALKPVAWVWNEPIVGDTSPTSIFK